MLHAGLDLSRKRLDVCLLSDQGELVEELTAFPDAGGLKILAQRVGAHEQPVCAVIESMTGARFVHDTLERPRLVGGDRRRPEGQGPGAAGGEDRPDRRPGAGGALPARPGAGDLATRPEGAPRARARPLSPPPGQAPKPAEEPDPLGADELRAPLPGHAISSGSRAASCWAALRSPSPGGETSTPASS